MKRKIGIGVLIVVNFAFVFVIIAVIGLSYGIINGQAGKIHAEAFTREITNEILVRILYISSFVVAVNYWVLKTVISNKKPFVMTCILLIIAIIIFTPFLLTLRQSFLNRQSHTDLLIHYYDRFEIKKAIILTPTDTIEIKELNDFTSRLQAQCLKAPIKYKKTMKIIFINNNGTNDTIPTNGQTFGPFKEKYFKADDNIIDDYLRRYNK